MLGLGQAEGHGLGDLLIQVQSKEEASVFLTVAAGPWRCRVVPASAPRVGDSPSTPLERARPGRVSRDRLLCV